MDYRLFTVAVKNTVLLLSLLCSWSGLLATEHDFRTLGPFGGDVRSLAVHPQRPDLFFLGTSDGQIYTSSDAGENWVKLTPGLERRDVVVDNLQFHPTNPDILYAATWELHNNRGWLFRTTDGGASWEHLPTGEYSSQIRAIALAPSRPDTIALGVAEGVLVSEDAGKTWRRINRGYRSLHNVESLAFDPRDPRTLYVGTWRLPWRTNDLGESWESIHHGMIFDSDVFSLLVNPGDPSMVFASACTGIYRSQDAGEKWLKLQRGLPHEAKRTRTLHFAPDDPKTIYAGTTAGVYVTHDAGASWQQIMPSAVVNAIAVSPRDSRIILVGTDDGGVYRSVDQGANFYPSNRGFIHRQIAAVAILPGPPDRILSSVALDGPYGGLFVSDDEGFSWQTHNQGLKGSESYIRAILPVRDGKTVYLGTAHGLFQGNLEGPWEQVGSTAQIDVSDMAFATPDQAKMLLVSSGKLFSLDLASERLGAIEIEILDGPVLSVLAAPDEGAVFAATEIGVLRTDDGGETWAMKVEGLPPLAVNTLAKSGNRMFAGTRNGLYTSTNSGNLWSFSEGVFPLDITALTIDPRNSNHILAADSAGGFLFESRDGGETWSSSTSPQRSRILQLLFTPSGRLLAGTLSEGVYQLIPRRPQVVIEAQQ